MSLVRWMRRRLRRRQAVNGWDETNDLCPNCVTPWKCNGPHLSEQTVAAPREQGLPDLLTMRRDIDYLARRLNEHESCVDVGPSRRSRRENP